MQTRRLSPNGPITSAVALGCMGMSDLYGPADEDESVATIRAALDAGITMLDTGDFYGMGHNELLIARALEDRNRDDVLLSVKFGAQRGPDGSWLNFDLSPNAIKTSLAYTLRRLNTDHVDIYRPARIFPGMPVEEIVGTIKELVDAGWVRYIGLSEVGSDTIRRAAAVAPISDVQIEWSLVSRGVEGEILPTCRELGTGITAYGVLSRGLLSGHWRPDRELAPGDFRSFSPRFQDGNLQSNLRLVDELERVAADLDATVAQVAIAWVLARGGDVVPLIGARRRDRLAESLGALTLEIDEAQLAAIEAAVPPGEVAGERYAAEQMATLDSER
jgi:aryl-alcohol dehydrogenase-like predicted oxidoreductase